MKYRKTICLDPNRLFKNMWGFQPIDMRKKYFECIHCKQLHETKLGVVRE